MDLGLRIGNDAACIITTTPTAAKVIKDLYSEWQEDPEGEIRITSGSTLDNAANLGESFIKSVKKRYANTRLERQEIFGEICFESENAYFTSDDIEKYRIQPKGQPVEYKRIIVAVDPAITNHEKSDEHGIIVGAIGEDDEGYILHDATMKGTPAQWASKVAELFEHYNADIIVAEQNQGGLMVQHTIHSHQSNLPVKLVTATRGKIIRLEPIGLLFEQGKIHLVGNFPQLEQQMVEYDGSQKYSPNNLDAFVWCMTEGFINKRRITPRSYDFLI